MKDFSCYTSGAVSTLSGGLWRCVTLAIAAVFFLGSGALAQKGQPAASLEQIRNGSAADPTDPAQWQNGNAGNQTAHYVESHSIGYRALLTNLPASTSVTLTLGYDIRHSGKNAIDFLTHYDRLQPHGQFPHTAQEVVDPRLGTSFAGQSPTSVFEIPRPNSNSDDIPGEVWDDIKLDDAEKVKMTMWGGTITAMSYVTPFASLTDAQAEQRITVTFTTSASGGSAVLAWGGHIANRFDWGFENGVPLSAGGISGSPYHMRLIDWNLNNLGNQDRSLSAAAVVPLVQCDIAGPAAVCGGTTNTYTGSAGGVTGATYAWSISGNGKIKDGAMLVTSKTIVAGATESSTSVDVEAEATGSYTLSVTISAEGFQPQTCSKVVTIIANPTITAPTIADVCAGATSASVSYTGTTGSPNQYRIDWNAAANTAGLVDIAYTALPSSPFSISIPGTLAPATYSGTIYVKNTTTGCESSGAPISLTVNPNPTITAPAIADVCPGATSASVSYTGTTGSPNQYRIDWNAAANTAGLVDIAYTALPSSPFSISIPGTLAPATYSGTIYVKNTTTGCESSGAPISLTVNPNPAAPAVSIVNPSCSSMTGSITVTSPLDDMSNDYEYSYNNGAYTDSPGPFTFQAGAGYSIKVRNKTTGCVSAATTCAADPNYVAPTSSLVSGASLSAKAVNTEKAVVRAPEEEMTAYPVPFSERATVEFRTTETEQYTLGLYDMKGALVKVLKSGTAVAGELQQVEVDGRALAEGIYIVRMTRDSGAESVKLLLKRK